MSLSLLLITVSAVLVAGGVCKRTLAAAGAGRKQALFFLLCAAVLSRFTLEPSEDIELVPSCLVTAAWLFGHAFGESSDAKLKAAILPFSIAAGFLTSGISGLEGDWRCYAAGLVPALLAIPFGTSHGMAAAALAPIFAALSELAGVGGDSLGSLWLTEYCLSSQLSGIMLSVLAGGVRSTVRRTNVRTISAERTTR